MRALFTFITILLLGFAAHAQINVEPMETEQQPKSNKEKPAKVEDAEKNTDHLPVFYQTKGKMAFNFNNHLLTKTGTASMPISLGADVTTVKNFTLGPIMSYYQLRNTTATKPNQDKINDGNTKYHMLTVGLRSTYHLMPLIQKMVNKPLLVDYVDVYVHAWGGYSFMFANTSAASLDFMRQNEKIRGGVGLGVRSMVLPRFGFFVEGGYGSLGYGSFGITVAIR